MTKISFAALCESWSLMLPSTHHQLIAPSKCKDLQSIFNWKPSAVFLGPNFNRNSVRVVEKGQLLLFLKFGCILLLLKPIEMLYMIKKENENQVFKINEKVVKPFF